MFEKCTVYDIETTVFPQYLDTTQVIATLKMSTHFQKIIPINIIALKILPHGEQLTSIYLCTRVNYRREKSPSYPFMIRTKRCYNVDCQGCLFVDLCRHHL